MPREERTYRVLDLSAGRGPGAPAIANQIRKRPIEYVIVDVNPELDKGYGKLEKSDRKRVRIEYNKEQLLFGYPDPLARQLSLSLGSQLFDEIHLHLPGRPEPGPSKHVLRQHNAGLLRSPHESLAELAKYLKPGGHIYHTAPAASLSPLLHIAHDGQLGALAMHHSALVVQQEEREGIQLQARLAGLNVKEFFHRSSVFDPHGLQRSGSLAHYPDLHIVFHKPKPSRPQ